MAEERFSEACKELHEFFGRLEPSQVDGSAWKKALRLFGQLCKVHE
jgi:hypothetical protein